MGECEQAIARRSARSTTSKAWRAANFLDCPPHTEHSPRIEFYRSIISRGGWMILILLIGAAVFFGMHISKLDVNAQTEALMDSDDPDLAKYNELQQEWGSDEYAIISVTRDEWFSEEGIATFKEIVADLQANVPHAGRTVSLLDVPLIRQKENPSLFSLMSGLKHYGDKGVDLEAARKELTGHAMALDNAITKDGRSLGLLLFMEAPPADARISTRN